MQSPEQTILVWGDYACFTEPLSKVERKSMLVPQPSAVRGIFDSIYCKPVEFRWEPTRVEVLAPPRFVSLMRNEVKEKVNVNAVERWRMGAEPPEPIFADGDRDLLGSDEKGRTQRQTIALKNVRYRVSARILPWPGFERSMQGFVEQFRRRVEHGKCFQQPYFGVREMVAYFAFPNAEALAEPPISLTRQLGYMVYDIFDLSRPGNANSAPQISVFNASIHNGVMHYPAYGDPAVRRAHQEEIVHAGGTD